MMLMNVILEFMCMRELPPVTPPNKNVLPHYCRSRYSAAIVRHPYIKNPTQTTDQNDTNLQVKFFNTYFSL